MEVNVIEAITVATHSRVSMEDITPQVEQIVQRSGVGEGLCTVFVPHTTAGVIVNENYDPDVKRDILAALARLVPVAAGYEHSEGNADAHIKASLLGNSVSIPISGGRLVLGTWQGVIFCEFDGPRTRRIVVHVTG